jgi:hypothetical protein
MWEPQRLTTLWAFRASYRDNFIFLASDTITYKPNPERASLSNPRKENMVDEIIFSVVSPRVTAKKHNKIIFDLSGLRQFI